MLVFNKSCLAGLLADHPVRCPRLLPLAHVADEVLGWRQVLPLGRRILAGPERQVQGLDKYI